MTCYVKHDSRLATYMEVLCYGFEFINIGTEEELFRNYARIFNKIDLSRRLVVLSVVSWLLKPIRSLSGEL